MKIQMVMAHPDDEVIFGWPMLQNVSSILCCSNDKDNPKRQWCKDRYKALEEIGRLLGIPVHSLDYNSEFYRLDPRDGTLRDVMDTILMNLDLTADAYYTHNWMGEYGHLDHLLVYQIMQVVKAPLITSTIRLDAGWIIDAKNRQEHGIPSLKYFAKVSNDLDFYQKCKEIYDKYHAWTWSQEPIEETTIVIL